MTEAEFEQFVTRHRAQLVRLARSRMIGLAHEAEHVVQDVLMKVWQTWDSERGNMLQFAIECTVNRASHYVEAWRTRHPEPGDSTPPVEHWDERASLQGDVAMALDSIANPADRAAAWMIYAEGTTMEEAGKIFGMPTNSMKSRMARYVLPILKKALALYRRDKEC